VQWVWTLKLRDWTLQDWTLTDWTMTEGFFALRVEQQKPAHVKGIYVF